MKLPKDKALLMTSKLVAKAEDSELKQIIMLLPYTEYEDPKTGERSVEVASIMAGILFSECYFRSIDPLIYVNAL